MDNVELLPCPFCGAALEVNNANLAAHPLFSTCWLARQFIVMDSTEQVEGWQARAQASALPVSAEPEYAVPSSAPPALYQHDDGRYALALGDVARHKLTDGDPAWHRVPIDQVVGSTVSVAGTATPPVSVPAGWQLVPEEFVAVSKDLAAYPFHWKEQDWKSYNCSAASMLDGIMARWYAACDMMLSGPKPPTGDQS